MSTSFRWNVSDVRLAYRLSQAGNSDLWHYLIGGATGSWDPSMGGDTYSKSAAVELLKILAKDCKHELYDSALEYFLSEDGPISASDKFNFLQDYVSLRTNPSNDAFFDKLDEARESAKARSEKKG